ncbi:MAG TPA: hypothetical protein VFH43_09890 [Candidatus Kapabacteria bacterium]|nr:hypothetical protein [Candidatus Kapabacteria bacterium]
MKRACSIIALIVLTYSVSQAQFDRSAQIEGHRNELVSSYTFFGAGMTSAEEIPLGLASTVDAPGRKSPYLAAALSLILPGLGEYYVGEQIWRGAIFTLLEAGLWYGNITYTNRGDDSTNAFHAFAHENWRPELYAAHLNELLKQRQVNDLITDPNNFDQIREAEDTLNSLQTQYFTHRLPDFGDQQYYELISKYNQFARGWRDASGNELSSSPLSFRHAVMRDNMNRQYEIAQTFVWGIFLNHVLSAIDAVLLAHDHNNALRIEGGSNQRMLPDGSFDIEMEARMSLRF